MKKTIYLAAIGIITVFSACKNETKTEKTIDTKEEKTEIVKENTDLYKTKGLEIAFGTKKILGKNLMGTMKAKGAIEALKFCNVKAMHLTDSMATTYNADIKRVSDKARNPNNKANTKELKNIELFKKIVANGEKIEPIIDVHENNVDFYYPIVTNDMCLKCHGNPDGGIDAKLLTTLNKLYPTDAATGYSENQVRGIWAIKFDK